MSIEDFKSESWINWFNRLDQKSKQAVTAFINSTDKNPDEYQLGLETLAKYKATFSNKKRADLFWQQVWSMRGSMRGLKPEVAPPGQPQKPVEAPKHVEAPKVEKKAEEIKAQPATVPAPAKTEKKPKAEAAAK